MPYYSSQEAALFGRYHNNVSSFITGVLCGSMQTPEDYVKGTEPVEFYEKRFRAENDFHVDDHRENVIEYGGLDYEHALFARFMTPSPLNMLVVVGGLGAGKSTTMEYLCNLFREREAEVREAFPCECGGCAPGPFYVDCLGVERSTPVSDAIRQVLARVRFAIYKALIGGWLRRNSLSQHALNEIPEAPKILRRLLITNDLARWADSSHPVGFPLVLQRPEYHMDTPLLGMEASEAKLRSLVSRYASSIDGLAEAINTITQDSVSSLDFTCLVCRFFTDRCVGYKPSNLIIIDNLDQLPTRNIEAILHKLHTLLTNAPDLPLLVPLRPSSINPRGHIRAIHYMYHYGPQCATLVLQRLQKYVLSRSKEDLCGAVSDSVLPKVFQRRPTDEELRAFLIATYIYAKLNAADGASQATQLTNGEKRLPLVHPDHRFLRGLELSREVLTQAAETLHALVGNCGRYATDQLAGFYESAYMRPRILADARRRGLLSGVEGAKVRISFGRLVWAMISPRPAHAGASRIVNVYAPSRRGSNVGLPTLAKLRVLRLLSGSEMTVEELVTRLGTFGIPSEVTIETLNDLHDRDRLLVWFSTNSDLGDNKRRDLRQYVSISEHGLAYLRDVVGDFEYMWYCALGVAGQRSDDEPSNFPARLAQFTRLIRAVGQTEWKQLAFRRCLASAIVVADTPYLPDECFTLCLLYRALNRAIGSSRFALAHQQPRSEYAGQVESLMIELCNLVVEWEGKYGLCVPGRIAVGRYLRNSKAVAGKLVQLMERDGISEHYRGSVGAVLAAWKIDGRGKLGENFMVAVPPPHDDFVTKCAQYTRGLIPGLSNYLSVLDSVEAAKVYFWHYVRMRERVANLMEHTLPTVSEVTRHLQILVDESKRVIESSSVIASTATTVLNWFVEEVRRLEMDISTLTENRIDDGPWRMHEMDVKKARCNNIMAIMERSAHRLGVRHTEHLGVRWA